MTRIVPAILVASLMACGNARIERQRESRHFRETIDGEGAKEVKAVVKLGAGELRMTGGADKLVDADIRTTGDKPRIRYDAGPRGRLEITQDSSFNPGNQENDWDLRFGGKAPLDLEIHLGAGKADLDLGDVMLRSLVVHMGAGKLDLDLRGVNNSDVDVEIHGGVGEARVRLPKKTRIEAEVHGGLGEIDAHGLDHNDDRYTSRGNPPASPKIMLEIHGGIGRIELDAD